MAVAARLLITCFFLVCLDPVNGFIPALSNARIGWSLRGRASSSQRLLTVGAQTLRPTPPVFARQSLLMCEDKPGGDSFSADDLKGLMNRVAEVRSRVNEIPLVILDAILPRQRLTFGTADPGFRSMIQDVMDNNKDEVDKTGALGSFAMIGVDPTQKTPLQHGTEVELLSALDDGRGRVDVEIVGRRRFVLVGEPWLEGKYFMSKVEWVQDDDSVDTDDMSVEVNNKIEAIVEAADKEANLELAKELEPLVEKWKRLVVDGGRERQPEQIATVLQHLGPMPSAARPRERALWVAALINPLPALGVAMEIRPATLSAKSTAEALNVVLSGIRGSIGHLDGSNPLW